MITEKIDTKLETTIKSLERHFEKLPQTKKFEDSIEEFEKLVAQGLVKKRGNNLISSADKHLQRHTINVAHHNEQNKVYKKTHFFNVSHSSKSGE